MANKNVAIYIIVGLVAAYFLVPSFASFINGFLGGSGAGGGSGSENPWAGKCLEHDSITMTLGPVLKKYDPGNSATPSTASNTVYDRVFIDGVDKGLKQDGTTMTVSYGQKVDIYYAANSSDFAAAKNSFSVPCAAAFDSAKQDSSAEESKIIAWKNTTVTVFNADDSLKNTQSNNQTITANDEKSMEMTVSFPGVGGVSPYGRIYVSIRVNNTLFDDVTMGGDDVQVSTPSTYRAKQNNTADMVYYTFSIPGHQGLGTVKKSYTLTFDTSSSVPATGTSDTANATIYFDDDNWYRNTETGEMILGPADNTRADVGATIYGAASSSVEQYRIVFDI